MELSTIVYNVTKTRAVPSLSISLEEQEGILGLKALLRGQDNRSTKSIIVTSEYKYSKLGDIMVVFEYQF